MNLIRRLVCAFRAFLVLLIIGCFCGISLAQDASLAGTVTDPQGGVVPGAEVTLINSSTRAERETVTDDEGRYAFALVPPGSYEIRVALTGFKTQVLTDVQLPVDRAEIVDIPLEVGQISEVVTIRGSSEAILNKVDATIGNTFNETQISDLPLNARNVVDLLRLQPGVIATGEVAGARRNQSNLMLDGVDVNDQQDGEAFTPVLRVTPDSVQEFRVTISSTIASDRNVRLWFATFTVEHWEVPW